jgi:hypothetical protein
MTKPFLHTFLLALGFAWVLPVTAALADCHEVRPGPPRPD